MWPPVCHVALMGVTAAAEANLDEADHGEAELGEANLREAGRCGAELDEAFLGGATTRSPLAAIDLALTEDWTGFRGDARWCRLLAERDDVIGSASSGRPGGRLDATRDLCVLAQCWCAETLRRGRVRRRERRLEWPISCVLRRCQWLDGHVRGAGRSFPGSLVRRSRSGWAQR
jgi:hypothetical protein